MGHAPCPVWRTERCSWVFNTQLTSFQTSTSRDGGHHRDTKLSPSCLSLPKLLKMTSNVSNQSKLQPVPAQGRTIPTAPGLGPIQTGVETQSPSEGPRVPATSRNRPGVMSCSRDTCFFGSKFTRAAWAKVALVQEVQIQMYPWGPPSQWKHAEGTSVVTGSSWPFTLDLTSSPNLKNTQI